jgi:uncharacterized OsmC-like protein
MSSLKRVLGMVKPGTSKFEASVDGYDLIIDYPAEGYQPEGPTPGAMVAFALGGCKALVWSANFSARKMAVTVGVEVSFDVQRDGRRGPYYADYKVALTFSGDIDEADLPKIKKVLDGQCTVQHILLSTNNTVETTYSIG